jgi:hypothetical protein
MITTDEMTLEEKLEAISKAMEQADGNSERETQLLSEIVDPQDALNCEGCQ